MKTRLLTAILLTVVMLTSCTTSFTLHAVKDSGNEITLDRGQEVLTASTDNVTLMLTGAPTYNYDEVYLVVGISNNTDQPYNFKDSQIEIFVGNNDTGVWTSWGKWNAAEYYQSAVDEARAEEFLMAFSGAMSVLSSTTGHYSTSYVYTGGGRVGTVTTWSYSPTDTMLASMWAASSSAALAASNRNALAALEQNLLFSSDIASHAVYSGIMYAAADGKVPDYRIVFTDVNGQQLSFVFSRSDRDRIIKR